MKELIPIAAFFPFLADVSPSNPLWERLLEKWGIGAIGMALLFYLAKWTARRETNINKEREKREADDREERNALMIRNNQLQETLIAAVNSNARKFEQISKDGIKATEDHASSLKMLVRKMRCVAPTAFEKTPET